MNVIDNVMLPSNRKISKNKVDNLLKELNIYDKKHVLVNKLSGGEKQRVAIARALINSPKIILADEPTGALDEETGKTVLEVLQRINEEFQTTIFLITHNLGIADMADKVVRMKSGEIVEVRHNTHKKRASEVSWA